jgi:hypothetical protein
MMRVSSGGKTVFLAVVLCTLLVSTRCLLVLGSKSVRGDEKASDDSSESTALEVLSVFDKFVRRHLISKVHPLTDPPDAPEDIEYAYAFVGGAEHNSTAKAGHEAETAVKLAAGDSKYVLVTVAHQDAEDARNSADNVTEHEPYLVVGAIGALHAIQNPSAHLQNMSFLLVNRTLTRGQELSFVYPLAVHAAFPPGPCILRLTVFLERQWKNRELLIELGFRPEQLASLVSTQPEGSIAAFLDRNSMLGYSIKVLDGVVEITPAESGREYRLLFTILAVVASTVVMLVAILISVDTPLNRKVIQVLKQQMQKMRRSRLPPRNDARSRSGETAAAAEHSNEWLIEHHQMMRSIVGTGSKGAVRTAKTTETGSKR